MNTTRQPSPASTHLSARAGMTLLELGIAILVLGIAAVAVFESMIATKHLASFTAAVDQVELDASAALREIHNDLTASGWEFVDTPASQTRSTASLVSNGTTTYAAVTPAIDRGLRYYPYVQIPANGAFSSGVGTRFPWTVLATGSMPTLPAAPKLPGSDADASVLFGSNDADWTASFYARSQQLIFLRSQLGAWNQTMIPTSSRNNWQFTQQSESIYEKQRPADRSPPNLDFTFAYTGGLPTGTRTTTAQWQTAGNQDTLGVLFPSGFTYDATAQTWSERYPNTPYGVVLDAGWYDPNDTTVPIKPLWESMSKLAASADFYGTNAQDLREFMYAVVPSPLPNSLGRLVRAYRVRNPSSFPTGRTDPGYRITAIANDPDYFIAPAITTNTPCAMVVDKVLAEDVVRVVFDTYRTVNTGGTVVDALGLNQIRVRLYLARKQVTRPDTIIYRIAETTISMRTRASAAEVATVSTVVGASPIGIIH